jgi:hypothetical protein
MKAELIDSTAADGAYSALMSDGFNYRLEKVGCDFYYSDGTGWVEPINDYDEIIYIEPVDGKPFL